MCRGGSAAQRNDEPSWKCGEFSSLWPEMELEKEYILLTSRIMVPALLMIFMSCNPEAEDVIKRWITGYPKVWLRCRKEWLQPGRSHSSGPSETWINSIKFKSNLKLNLIQQTHFHFLGQRKSLVRYSTEKKAMARLRGKQIKKLNGWTLRQLVNVNVNVNIEETRSHYKNIEKNNSHCINIEEISRKCTGNHDLFLLVCLLSTVTLFSFDRHLSHSGVFSKKDGNWVCTSV